MWLRHSETRSLGLIEFGVRSGPSRGPGQKRRRFSEEQIIAVLKEQEAGVLVADLCRKHGASDAGVYKWKAKFGGTDMPEARRLRTLEDESAKLKRMLADAMLDNVALRDPRAGGWHDRDRP